MPGLSPDEVPFPYLCEFRGEVLVLYSGEVKIMEEQNVDEAADVLLGQVRNKLLDLLKSRESVGAVPLHISDLSVHPYVDWQELQGACFSVKFEVSSTRRDMH